jgi:hypothetical protein
VRGFEKQTDQGEEMKLKRNEFEKLARRYGYKNGYQLIKALGCSKAAYEYSHYGGNVTPDLLAEIYNRFGDETMFEVINFEED